MRQTHFQPRDYAFDKAPMLELISMLPEQRLLKEMSSLHERDWITHDDVCGAARD